MVLLQIRRIHLAALLALLPWIAAGTAVAEEGRPTVHHDLKVRMDPGTHTIEVEDVVRLDGAGAAATGPVRFHLHAGLEVTSLDGGILVKEAPAGERREGGFPPLRSWQAELVDGGAWPEPLLLRLRYEGRIHHPPRAEGEEYARSFARTVGTIGEEGAVLTRATWWVPAFGEDLLTFRLACDLPEGWDCVSQGTRREHDTRDGRQHTAWDSPHPMEEVYLIANRFHEYSRPAGKARAYAFLREKDPNLAARYLEATAQYLDMYGRLIGPYPFGKFALVENFWETGYGMPSFTLLGSQVIRFPFILHSSYPHEILHNWWGNSVYVDWATGNWCEGLTAYMADHLIKEGQGRGEEYRRDTLKKYRNYVRGGRDFPLTEFRSRRSGATEAIGYGKALMVFHMLRRRMGDEAFTQAVRHLYRDQRWKSASWADLTRVFSDAAGEDLTTYFSAWVEREGAPVLALDAEMLEGAAVSGVGVRLRQTQEEAPWPLRVPVAVTYDDGKVDERILDLEGREGSLLFPAPTGRKAVRVDADPNFDVFRRLDLSETPPTNSELFGADKVTLVVPTAESERLSEGWRTFAATWQRGAGGQVEVVAEDAIEALPTDRAVWVLGSNNRFRRALAPALEGYGGGVKANTFAFGVTDVPRANHSAVFVVRHPGNAELALGWVATDVEAALPGLARKLPHYGKYSYLAFAGPAPDNVAKGEWAATASPLVAFPAPTADGATPVLPPRPLREPLARLAPVFDPDRLMDHVRTLADDAMEGRGVGTPGLDRAAAYIAKAFAEAGLEPAGDDGTYFQAFDAPDGPDGKSARLQNVVAVLPGTDPAWSEQSVVLGAHYDHLGRGWPDVRSGHEGKIHNGADDNASGVGVLLEVARILRQELKPRRSIVFVAFTGEEWGLKGSTHYVESMKRYPVEKALAMVNLDTVGRLGEQKLQVLGSGTAREWRHIAMGVGYTTGVESNCIADDPHGSDQVSFQRAGVPAVQLFTGAHEDYHRSTDDVEKVDAEGLVKVAIFTRETIVYLSARDAPMTATTAGAAAPASAGPKTGRRVSLGTVPDFAHRGRGVRVDGVVEASAAEAAGVKAGDVLLAIDGEALGSLRAYSELLKRHQPGDEVRLTIERDGQTLELKARLRAR